MEAVVGPELPNNHESTIPSIPLSSVMVDWIFCA